MAIISKASTSILVLGDQVTTGERTAYAWPEAVEIRLGSQEVRVCNRAVAGSGLLDLVRSFDAPPREPQHHLLIVMLPVNDAKGTGISPDRYIELLGLFLARAARVAYEVIVIPPLEPYAHKGQPRGFGRPARRWWARVVDAIRVASKQWPPTVYLREVRLPETLLMDGIHPTLAGQVEIGKQIALEVAEILD
jgi:lysophospholipase L1-like esterase